MPPPHKWYSFKYIISCSNILINTRCFLCQANKCLLEMDFSSQVEQHWLTYYTSFLVDLTGWSLVLLNHRKLMRANRCHGLEGTMSSTTTCWDKIDQRQDPVILCQSLADVQWPLVTIRVLCTVCASMSKCTCLLLTLNPHRGLAGSS